MKLHVGMYLDTLEIIKAIPDGTVIFNVGHRHAPLDRPDATLLVVGRTEAGLTYRSTDPADIFVPVFRNSVATLFYSMQEYPHLAIGYLPDGLHPEPVDDPLSELRKWVET